MVTRRSFLKQAGAAAALTAFWPKAQAAQHQRPNIIWICCDDHAQSAISAYGELLAQAAPTPNIDRIAREGALFRNSFVSNSICGPSRAVVLTGLFSHKNGYKDNRSRFDGSQQTFPKLLQQAGYETALFGKWHLHSDPTGFHHWEILPGQGDYYNPDFITKEGQKRNEGYVTDLITDKALHWLEHDHDTDKPFMMMVQHNAPHREWLPSPKHLRTYEDTVFPEPETLFDDYATRGTAAHTQDMTIEKTMRPGADLKLFRKEDEGSRQWKEIFSRMTAEERADWEDAYKARNEEYWSANYEGEDLVRFKYQCYMKDYLRCVASVDDNVGRMLDYLEQSGLDKNTLILYSSDQGFYLGEHGWFDKRFMYEQSVHTPLLARWPEVIEPGTEITAMVQNLDYAETFLALAGAPIPDNMQGASMLPLLRGETPDDWRKSIYYHYYEGEESVHAVYRHYGVRTERYKLMYFYTLDEWEFYDLQEDPHELRNEYNNPDYAEEIENAKKELDRLRQLYEVPEDNE